MLNLLALLAFLLALTAVVVRTGRRLSPEGPRADASQMKCVACGAPAARLTGFTCPSCGADVREAGLAAHGTRDATAPLWTLLGWTMLLLVAAFIATKVIGEGVSVYREDFDLQADSTVQSGAEGVTVAMRGRGRSVDQKPQRVELVADLTVKGGGYAALEVEGPPFRGRVVDAAGRQTGDDALLDLPLAHRWFAAAGADPSTALADHEARNALQRIADNLHVRIDIPRSDKPPPNIESSMSSGGGGRSAGRVPPDWFQPVSLLFWTAVWLGGAWFVTRSRRGAAGGATPTPAQQAAASGPAAGGAA